MDTTRLGLLLPLQNLSQKLKVGERLKLHCASYSDESIYWTFTKRSLSSESVSHSSKQRLIANKTNELLIVNVTVDDNDGIYTCHSGNNSQSFDVLIVVKPYFTKPILSTNTSVAVPKLSLTCEAAGNPHPTITWFHNGVLLKDDYRVFNDGPVLNIHSLESEDDGIYQCFANNGYDEIYSAGYLTVRKQKFPIYSKPENVKCFPINHTSVEIKYTSELKVSVIPILDGNIVK